MGVVSIHKAEGEAISEQLYRHKIIDRIICFNQKSTSVIQRVERTPLIQLNLYLNPYTFMYEVRKTTRWSVLHIPDNKTEPGTSYDMEVPWDDVLHTVDDMNA